MHISISPRSGARRFKHLSFFNDAIEWKSRVSIVEKCQQNANVAALANETFSLYKLPMLSFLVSLKFY